MANIDCPACGMIHKYTITGLTALLNAAVEGELHTVGRRGRRNGHAVVEVAPRCLEDVVPAMQTLSHPRNPPKKRPGRPRKVVEA